MIKTLKTYIAKVEVPVYASFLAVLNEPLVLILEELDAQVQCFCLKKITHILSSQDEDLVIDFLPINVTNSFKLLYLDSMASLFGRIGLRCDVSFWLPKKGAL
jgi:hypothetical protein